MHNSDVIPSIPTCEGCGTEVKPGKTLCSSCKAAKEVMTKGAEHTRSSTAVKGLKQIYAHGRGWAEQFLV